MTLEEMLKEERQEGGAEGLEQGRVEGRVEGRTEGRAEEVFDSVKTGDYDIRRGMEKLNIKEEKEFREKAAAMGFIIP